jgi:hypothetical protein
MTSGCFQAKEHQSLRLVGVGVDHRHRKTLTGRLAPPLAFDPSSSGFVRVIGRDRSPLGNPGICTCRLDTRQIAYLPLAEPNEIVRKGRVGVSEVGHGMKYATDPNPYQAVELVTEGLVD